MNKFVTSDYKMATSLLTAGFSLETTSYDRQTGRVSFLFEDTEELKEAVTMYYTDQLVVSARRLFENITYMKDLVHSYRRGELG